MYVAILPDGTILPGGATADSAVKAMEREGVSVKGTEVDDIGSASVLSHEVRRNEGRSDAGSAYAKNALKNAGLPARLTRSEVMGGELADPENAVRRLYPIFQHHRAESVSATGGMKTTKTGKQQKEMKQDIISVTIDPVTGKEVKKVAWVSVAFVKNVAHGMQPGARLTKGQIIEFASELMGDNSKLVKGTTKQTSPYSLTTKKDGRLIGLNLYPAGKLAHEFVAAYPYHPISQIITSIQKGRGVPEYVNSIPTGMAEKVERVATNLTREQEANLVAAFGKTTFTLCSGASKACMRSCLVYTGQNTASIKNDWKKAACAFALIADPAAYLRLVSMEVERNARLAAKDQQMFFVRMNLLSDVPWEEMVPWFFKDFDGRDGRPFAQFYDYTKIKGRDPARHGVSNYDLTFSFSGTNAGTITDALYGRNKRVAVVFVGVQLENGELVQIAKPKGVYGIGLPLETDIFAPAHLVGKPEGMRAVVNADTHDARPLDPPNSLYPDMGCIAGLVWKDAGGGATMTAAQKAAATTALRDAGKFVTYTELVEGTGDFRVRDRSNPRRDLRINGQRVTGFLIAAETPRQTGVGLDGASLLPGV
jgi:hypothetical protein